MQNHLKKSTLKRGISIFAMLSALMTASAYAQTANSDGEEDASEIRVEEEIVVTGIRSRTHNIVGVKRSSFVIQDSLTADQIKLLPDNSLAEVLGRIAGVSTDLGFNGTQARTATVRGFDSRYNSTEIDGVPVWNSSRNNRGTQLDVFPSSAINQVDVYKTITPSMDGNSVGAHLSMRTIRAFDKGIEPYMKASISKGFYNKNGEPSDGEGSYRVDAVGTTTFGPDNKFGVVLGLDLQKHEYTNELFDVTGYSQINGNDVPNGNLYRGKFQPKIKRTGVFGKLEARESDQYYTFLMANYFREDDVETFNYTGVFVPSKKVTNAGKGTGDFTKGTAEAYFEDYSLDRETLLLATGLDYRIGELSSVELRGSYTDMNHREVLSRSRQFQVGKLSGSYDIGNDKHLVTLDPASVARVSDPANWVHKKKKAPWDFVIPHNDSVYSLSAQYKYNAHPTSEGFGVVAGVEWRKLSRVFDQSFVSYKKVPKKSLFLDKVLHPNGDFQTTPDGVNTTFIDGPAYWAAVSALGATTTSKELGSDYTLDENVYAFHANLMYSGANYRIMGGARVEVTDYTNDSAVIEGKVVTPETREAKYTNFLPNVQAIYNIKDNLKFRVAFTKTLARPDFADFAMGTSISFDKNNNKVIKRGNPDLDARLSSNLDASLEYYFSGGLISVGGFYKNIDNETFEQVIQTRDANDVVTLTEVLPLNSGSAKVKGLELVLIKDSFEQLPGFLSGLGFNGNLTIMDGQWDVVFKDGTRRSINGLRNQPKWIANLNLVYNYDKFGASLGYRLRGKTFRGKFGPNVFDDDGQLDKALTEAGDLWADNYNRLDLKAHYAVTDKFTVFSSVKNLTNEAWVEQKGLDNSLSRSINGGRTIWLGLKFEN